MATKVDDNLLKCSICVDIFQVPKYLWHSFSDCIIPCLSTMETIKLLSGKLFAHASMLFFKSPSVTNLRQMGHLKLLIKKK
jgi:hypothetical protein